MVQKNYCHNGPCLERRFTKNKKECSLPLTGKGVVNKIITERALIEVTSRGLELKEVFEGFSVEDVIQSTEANLIVENVKESVSI